MLGIYYIQIYIVKLWTIWKFFNRQVPDRRLQTRNLTISEAYPWEIVQNRRDDLFWF